MPRRKRYIRGRVYTVNDHVLVRYSKANRRVVVLNNDKNNMHVRRITSLYDKNGKNTGTWHDLTQDESFEIDTDIMRECTHEDIYNSIEAVFVEYGVGNRTARSKKIFTTYVEDILNDNERRQIDIGNQYGVSKYAVCRTIQRYAPLLKEELIKRGY